MARVFQLSWFKQAKKLPVREIRRKSGFHSLQLTSRAGRWGFRSHASFDKGVLGWNGKSDFHTLCQGYGSIFARTPTRWLKAKTSPTVVESMRSNGGIREVKCHPHILKANCVTMPPKGHELEQIREFIGNARIISTLRYTSERSGGLRGSSIGLSAAARTVTLIWRTESDPQRSTGKPNASQVISSPLGACVQIAGAR
jgi:hypothetical protein